MGFFLRSFFRGLLFVVPVGLTAYILYWVFVTLESLVPAESWLGVYVPGLGVALAVAVITSVGFLASLFLTRWIVTLMDRIFQRVPIAKLIYGAIKDLMEAFVGEKRKFDRPVLVALASLEGEALGFITRDDLTWLGRKEAVAVYFPQSYNFAGNVLVVAKERVTPVEAEPSVVMQFIVSGGVSGAT